MLAARTTAAESLEILLDDVVEAGLKGLLAPQVIELVVIVAASQELVLDEQHPAIADSEYVVVDLLGPADPGEQASMAKWADLLRSLKAQF